MDGEGKALTDQEIYDLVLEEVALAYGPFDPRVDIEGQYYIESRTPHTSYPAPYDQFRIAINIPSSAEGNSIHFLLHLGHEVVHCLHPNGRPSYQATVFEEGLAEHFKIHLATKYTEYTYEEWLTTLSTDYGRAFDLIEKIVKIEGLEGMREGVRALRAGTGLPFGKMTLDHLQQYFPNVPDAVLLPLSQNFKEYQASIETQA